MDNSNSMPNRWKMKNVASLSGRLFARNAVFNLTGEIAAFVIGAVCIPYVVRKLGTDAFGILSISWALLGYMSLFDLGLSRATTKFVAEAVSIGNHDQIPTLVWTSISFQLVFGVLSGSVLVLKAHWLATTVFRMPPTMTFEATKCFQLLGIATPIILVTNGLRGMLEALQHFDLINYIKTSTNVLMFSSPFFLIPFGGGLASILLSLTVLRFLAMLVYFKLCFAPFPRAKRKPSFERQILSRLFKYGGWVTITNIAGPILMYADRFALGSLLSVAAVAYYTGPADMLNRTLVIPASLGSTLFPAFSSLEAAGAMDKLEDIYARSMKYLIVTMGPLLLVVSAFARDILHLWLGPVFAAKSTAPMQLLALATFLTALSILPYGLLQGAGRPDLTALFHLVELPIHVALVWVLVSRMGITGAAIAVTIRVLLDFALIVWACDRVHLASLRIAHQRGVTFSFFGLLAVVITVIAISLNGAGLGYRIIVVGACVAAYLTAQWNWSFDSRDRQFLVSTIRHFGAKLTNLPDQIQASQALTDPSKISAND
jgi:O-antigen/teichoic acid export membrane protein